jgi:hypothetical protein
MNGSQEIRCPETINGWVAEGPPVRIDRTTIFDYLDGGGELYLAYKFEGLLVCRYTKEPDNEIVVEIYQLENPDEAFGLLSLDWTGEPVTLSPGQPAQTENPVSLDHTALYGEGLLRARTGNLYLRILASRETPDARKTILELGSIIAGKNQVQSVPAILGVIEARPESGWKIRREKTAYFHFHLVLNSLYYLSHGNILNLNHSTDGLFVSLEKKDSPPGRLTRLLVFSYPDSQAAQSALDSFVRSYLPEKKVAIEARPVQEKNGTARVEDGWLGWRLSRNFLALVFECPEQESATDILSLLKFP